MKVKCRKVTAALLCCVLAVLSFTAELSHHHGLPSGSAVSVQAGQSGNDGGKAGLTHNYSCVACQFTVSCLAACNTTTLEAVITSRPFFINPSTIAPAQFFFQLSSLRAPPAVFA